MHYIRGINSSLKNYDIIIDVQLFFTYLCEMNENSCDLSFSVKWVGLFVILLAGLVTVKQLWDLLGDLNLSMASIIDFNGCSEQNISSCFCALHSFDIGGT